VLERPLFAPDRRPPPPPAPPPPPDPMANIQIHGIFSGASPGIIVRVDGGLRRVKVNDSVGSWTLKSIEGRDVTFAQGDEKRQLRLNYANLGVPTQQTAARAPTGQASGGTVVQAAQDEARERFRAANALRAAHGLPVISQ